MADETKINGRGFTRIVKAFQCSLKGFRAAYRHESAFRQELLLCAVLVPLSFLFSSTITEWVLLICSLLLLLFAELLNSAIEALADSVSLEHRELLGRAKDLGSAAVLIAIVILVMVWLSVIVNWF